MANPRDLAEQAFALLQSALSESEARASELDEQLKRKRAPKTQTEDQLESLSQRLASVEAERVRWEQQAGHLEEVAEAERVKVAQLKKKLEIAESGPEKLTKKEVNFWRAKAEEIDAQIKEYQERFNALRRELNERDVLIEALKASGGTQADSTEPQRDSDHELRRQLEQRDNWLAELRLELHELRGQPAPPLETEAAVETLRGQVAGLERALAEAHNMRAAAQADLARTETDTATRERAALQAAATSEQAAREAVATNERARAMLAEREHRLVELSAEIEHVRNELRHRDEQEHAAAARHSEEVAALARDIEALRGRLEQDRHDMSAARSALEIALHEREHEIDRQRHLLATNERDIAELRSQIEEREQASAEARRLVEKHRFEMLERDRELADRQQQLRELGQALTERDHRHSASSGELEQLRTTLAAQGHDIDSLRDTLHGANRELEHARATLTANERELTSLRDTLAGSSRELDELRMQKQRLETALVEAEAGAAGARSEMEVAREQVAGTHNELEAAHRQIADTRSELEAAHKQIADTRIELEAAREQIARSRSEIETEREQMAGTRSEIEAAREQIAGLETELKEEREHAESLGELANERREHMTKLQEQAEEAEERYADANWRLGKSLHFERLVKRRKGLIEKLLAALRAKMKANTALKAGLDGLRTFKATAEMNQHKLLARIDSLKADLKEAEDTVKRHQGATATKEELTSAISRAAALEERINVQAELIQSLEADLKTARLAHKTGDNKHQELDRLAKELEAKNQIIARLQADADDQQRKLSKLRGSESETVRLKALTEKDRSEIDALQREVTELREALSRQNAAAQASANAEIEAKLKDRENSVTRLMGTIKEHETTIKKLNESADSWKRKYQFLATDQPDAYKNTAEK